MGQRLSRTVAIALAVGAILVLPADRGWAATCASDPAVIARSDVVFVGQLTAVSAAGDQATLAVEEVWSASSLAPVVAVSGFPGQWSREIGGRYLVLASVVAGSLHIGQGECDIALPWDASYSNLRPATAHPPQEADTIGEGPPPELLYLGALAILLVGVSAFAFRRTPGPGG